ncbi:phage portal protein, PBSX family [Thiothrix eikelboomii]|uniref:Phage portal protein, PBSX family n=1 Tax=Thiothrix eikelboomii TaxID=92487 RepID=A0A1T4WUW0_9GAMM|nr:phage portal protein [Thiothrix eikelboomii]SKA81160.1 phage portal protein, PBSX family [Thiothrix eikelboomii]
MNLRSLLSFGRTELKPLPWEAFTFGDPAPVLSNLDLIRNYLKSRHNGRYYETPLDFRHLYNTQYANPHHLSAMQLKVNLLCALFTPSDYLPLPEFRKFALNALVLGNAYLEEIPSKSQLTPKGFISAPAMYVRRMDDAKYGIMRLDSFELKEFNSRIYHWQEDDLEQEYYGKPYYLAGLQAAWLNEEATLFRRKYYRNGNHAGFILYLSDPAYSLDDVKNLKLALKESKGPGAFRNLFLYAPKGKKDGIQVIPVESAQAQDKFFDIKGVSMADVCATHRVPPNMMAVQSSNAGGFGNITEARDALIQNEIVPLAKLFAAVHPVLQFDLPK